MEQVAAPTDPDEYAARFIRDLGAEVRCRRERLGMSAYALGRVAKVSDQTILNLEQGNCDRGCLTSTLCRVAWFFGTTFSELVAAAERRGARGKLGL